MASSRSSDLMRQAIADNFRQARQAAGLTQEELASRIPTTQATISRLEAGKTASLTPEIVLGWSVATGCPPSRLLGRIDEFWRIAQFERGAA